MPTKKAAYTGAPSCRHLPGGQVCAQLAAGGLGVIVGGAVADQTLLAEQDGAVAPGPVAPVPHPLAVAPAVRAEQRRLPAVQRAFHRGEHGLELAFFQLFGSYGGASKSHYVVLFQYFWGDSGARQVRCG